MGRTFQDRDLLVWEAFASGGAFGFSRNPHIVFHCLTRQDLRPRFVELDGNEADAERLLVTASPMQLLEILANAREVS